MIYFKLHAYICLFDNDPDHPNKFKQLFPVTLMSYLEISSKSVNTFLRNVGHRQTDRKKVIYSIHYNLTSMASIFAHQVSSGDIKYDECLVHAS